MLALTQDTSPSPTAPADPTESLGTSLNVVIWAGFGVLLLFLVAFGVSLYRGHRLSVTFARVYGLLAVAVVGSWLCFVQLAAETRSAAFALLGAVAGYLAGASPTPAGPAPQPPGGGQLEAMAPPPGAPPTQSAAAENFIL
jgi:hypothetical protein